MEPRQLLESLDSLYKNNSSAHYPQYNVYGDFFWDVFSTGEFIDAKWTPDFVYKHEGGALNTHRNLCAILQDTQQILKTSGYGGLSPTYIYPHAVYKQTPPTLNRLISTYGTQSVWSTIAINDQNVCSKSTPVTKRYYGYYNRISKNISVISEYNKGGANKPIRKYLTDTDLLIVDSKYRTLHPDWFKKLNSNPVKIWHATGREYDDTWGNKFDFVIHTDGSNPVQIYDNQRIATITLPVPDTHVVDTCGAGDTLTAAVAAYLGIVLASHSGIDTHAVIEATKFGIWCAQDVIQKEYTVTCSKTLHTYLTSPPN